MCAVLIRITTRLDLFQVCLKAQCYTAALPTLDEDVLFLPSEGKFNALHLLQYYYYGGMAYCAVKNFARALEFFSVRFQHRHDFFGPRRVLHMCR